MPWERPTLNEIVTRIESDIESRLTGNVPLLRFSVLKVLARVFSGIMHILYGYIAWVADQLFPDTAEDEFLDRHATTWGIKRKAATFATGILEITGTATAFIPTGTLWSSSEGYQFASTEDKTFISGTLEVPIKAVIAGESGNIKDLALEIITAITNLDDPSNIKYVDGVGLSGGNDLESNAALQLRILQRIQNPPMGGNIADYKAWAMSISRITNAWVFPTWSGAGTVGVAVRTSLSAGTDASPALVTEVQTYIDLPTVKPLRADVTVFSVVKILVEFGISISPYSASAAAAIEANLISLFDNVMSPNESMKIDLIKNAIIDAGIIDSDITLIVKQGGGPLPTDEDIPFPNYEFGVVDVVTIISL